MRRDDDTRKPFKGLTDPQAIIGSLVTISVEVRKLGDIPEKLNLLLRRIETPGREFALIPTLDTFAGTCGVFVSDLYGAICEEHRRIQPYVDEMFRRSWTNWRDSVTDFTQPCYWCTSGPVNRNTCEYCKGAGTVFHKGMTNETSITQRSIRVGFVIASVLRKMLTNNGRYDDYTVDPDAAIVEAVFAGVPTNTISSIINSWHFHAVAKRFPTSADEPLFLAFQAAWEAGNQTFARDMVRQKLGVTPPV